MRDIISRLSELEAKIKSKSNIPVLFVDENSPGIFTWENRAFTQEQLEEFCASRCVESIIIDNLKWTKEV